MTNIDKILAEMIQRGWVEENPSNKDLVRITPLGKIVFRRKLIALLRRKLTR